MILNARGLKKSYGTEVLRDVSFCLDDGEKAALVGVNGAGKTTVFRILTGEEEADAGTIELKKGADFTYTKQADDSGGGTLYEALLCVFADIIALEGELKELEARLEQGGESGGLAEKYLRLRREFDDKKGYSCRGRVESVIAGLGFSEEQRNMPLGAMSGGEKMRARLAKLLLGKPDLLLLDEPTNHLDIASVAWLENFLAEYDGAALIISHDRYFLDKIVTKVIELENGRTKSYGGNYTEFSVRREIERETAERQYLNQQKEIKRQEEVIRVLRSYNREKSVKRAESRQKLLDKMPLSERPGQAAEKMRVTLSPKRQSGLDVLKVEDLAKSYAGPLFSGVSFEMKRGEKAALIGANGAGKSTIFRIIMREAEPDGGKAVLGAGVCVGFYDQENQNINRENTIIEELRAAAPGLGDGELRKALAAFVFTGDEVFKATDSLSGGELGRVAFAKIMLGAANFLLLDEPTNNLDMYSKEILEDALNNYTGTVLYISHDRYFINATADKIIELTPDGANIYYGDYDYYLTKKAEEQKEIKETPVQRVQKPEKSENPGKAARRRKAALSKLEAEIEKTEREIKGYEEKFSEEEVYASQELSREFYGKKAEAEGRLAALYGEWENLAESGDGL
ncbi:MAG: ABC-F family ATP-binding cassette domain-containing protein [Clostridiales bacterium]|jgi:ATP-binding cassette subfamily F protein 3|nr:ABC-F family ATP-binding cassette domain-containing protein [Clostridiales bacterium]